MGWETVLLIPVFPSSHWTLSESQIKILIKKKKRLKPTIVSLMDVAGSYTFHRAVVPNLGCTVEPPGKYF